MRRTDQASLTIHASQTEVYRALVDPVARAVWLSPAGMTGRVDRWDARAGGGYRMVLTYDDPAAARGKSSPASDVVEARFIRLDEASAVVEAVDFESDDPAFAGTMTMTWTLEGAGDSTVVTITADDVPVGIDPADHDEGLRSSLAQLASYVRPAPQR